MNGRTPWDQIEVVPQGPREQSSAVVLARRNRFIVHWTWKDEDMGIIGPLKGLNSLTDAIGSIEVLDTYIDSPVEGSCPSTDTPSKHHRKRRTRTLANGMV